MTMPVLSAEQLQFFQDNGFVGPFKIHEPEEARDLLQEIRAKNFDRSNILFDNQVNYDRHFDIQELTHHIGHPGIVGRVSSILGSDILCWRTEFFPKFPGSKATEWHQVEEYQYATGKPQLVATERPDCMPMELTTWTAFTEATRENGCMKFIPGSHTKRYYDESKLPARGRDGEYESVISNTAFFGYNFSDFKVDPDWEPDESKAAGVEMRAGEMVIFTARCVHGSLPNITQRSTRFAISARYVPTHVRVYPDMTEFDAHGGHFDLTRFGCVLVAGTDRYNHNRIRTTNNLGEPFPYVQL
jgi:non-haem Fe2+, alpha-ketoglutarate-dependent halogenase